VFVSPSFSLILAYVCTEHILVRYKICALPVKKPDFAGMTKRSNFFSAVRSEAAEDADEVLGPAVAQVEHEDDERNLHKSQAQAQRRLGIRKRYFLNKQTIYKFVYCGSYSCFIRKIYGVFNI
jgi:hypothetical protein